MADLKTKLWDAAESRYGDRRKRSVVRMLTEMRLSGLSITEMAARFGCPATSIQYWIYKLGVKAPKSRPTKVSRAVAWLGFESEGAYFIARSSSSFPTMAEELDVCEATVRLAYKNFRENYRGIKK